MSNYSLKSFVLLWMAVFVLSFMGFIYITLNLFFSEHITSSSLKDLKYTAHVAKLNLSEEQGQMKETLARHITSPEFLSSLRAGHFEEVKRLVENWKELLKISKIQLYNEKGQLLDLSTGVLSGDSVALSEVLLGQLNTGYEQETYAAKKEGLFISVQRKIIDEEQKNLGYLFEWKKISYARLLRNSDSEELIVSTHGDVVYTSKGVRGADKISEKVFLKGSRAFELSLSGKVFEVFRLDIVRGITFFLAKENLRALVFKGFYKKYLSYFSLYISLLVLLFYLSYRVQVFRPLEQISKFITERKLGTRLQVETSVYEISLIAERLREKLSSLSDDVEKNKKSRVDDMSRLVSSVAHELNNSLSYLGGNLEYIREELEESGETNRQIDKEELSESILSAQSGYERIKKIVSDLRVFSTKRNLDVEWVPLEALKERLQKEFTQVDVSFPDELFGSEVKIDEDRTFQIIRNLVINAEQAYHVEELDKKTLVSFHMENSSLIVSVKDWAGGVSKEVKGKIFEPFFTTKKNTGGAGLGLALSRTLAREMDADLFLKRTNSEGTVFCFKVKHFRLKG